MAYDKVIDSSVLDANLKSVANAIRTKGGTSANLAFPTGFVNAISEIETGGNIEKHEITFASDITGRGNVTSLLTNNQFIKDNYSKSGFYVIMRAKSITSKIGYGVFFLYVGNIQLMSGVSSTHGVGSMLNSGATAAVFAGSNGAVSSNGNNLTFRATSAGALNLYTPANRNIGAGTYELFLVCEE